MEKFIQTSHELTDMWLVALNTWRENFNFVVYCSIVACVD